MRKSRKKSINKSDREYLSKVADLGCIVCRNHLHIFNSPAEIHHIRTGQGMGQRASHREVLPLCPPHHRNGGHGIAFHAGSKTWQERYGTELELLEKVRELVV